MSGPAVADRLVVGQPSQGRTSARWLLGAVGACLVVATASLAWPATLGFDPWIWVAWGRDLVAGDLDTSVAIAWKPLPAMVTAPAALVGAPVPEVWLVIARAGGLLALVMAWRVAARQAGWGAGLVAAGGLVLSTAIDARFLRLTLQGSVEPLVAALALLAVDRHLDGRDRTAFVLGMMAGMARPEAWPLVVVHGAWLWWRRPQLRAVVGVGLVSLPVLWFGGDWLGSGDALTGADRAQVFTGLGERWNEMVFRTSRTVAVPLWVAAGMGVLVSAWRRAWTPVVVAGGALAWTAVVAAMTLGFGYAAQGRFLLPAAAGLCVVAGVGTARLVGWAPRRWRWAVVVLVVAVALPFGWPLAQQAGEGARLTASRATLAEGLDTAIADAGGSAAVTACGHVVQREGGGLAAGLWPSMAWRLGIPLASLERELVTPAAVVTRASGSTAQAVLDRPDAQVVGRSEQWLVHAVACPGLEPAGGSSPRTG